MFTRLTHLFRTAHAVVINNMPYTHFSWICQLDQKKGLDIGKTYLNDKSFRVFVEAVAMSVRESIRTEIESSRFVSILCDGSMDSSIIDNEIVYLRYITTDGPKVRFVGSMQVGKADAKSIVDAMPRACSLNGLNWDDLTSKMVALGSDGASVMLGKKGVAALLKNLNNSIVPVHCFEHR